MRQLEPSERQSALEGLSMVTITDGKTGCGADKPTLTIEVTTPKATNQYADSLYACVMEPEDVHVDAIDAAFSALRNSVRR